MLERTDEDDRTIRIIADRMHLAPRRGAHVRRPGAGVAVRVRSLVQAEIARIIKAERTTGELAREQLEM